MAVGSSTTLRSLQSWLRPYAAWLLSLAPYAGARTVRVTSVKRSRALQRSLYASYRAGRSSYPAAPPGTSQHEYGLAWDMVTEPYSALYTLGAWWTQAGGQWGGEKDPIHFGVRL